MIANLTFTTTKRTETIHILKRFAVRMLEMHRPIAVAIQMQLKTTDSVGGPSHLQGTTLGTGSIDTRTVTTAAPANFKME
jgi:hypothetical protein